MCGIVGCVGKIWKAEQDAFKLMLQLDTIRGPHSTGVMQVGSTTGDWASLKQVGTPWELMDDGEFTKLMNRTHRMLCGHNRYATVGGVNVDNAHPFNHDHIVGVHNGTIRNLWRLKDHTKQDVDSSVVFANISSEGVEETLKKLEGPFALVWYNADEHRVYMVRNKERPLSMTRSEDGNTYFWASEPWMLAVALGKNSIKHGEIVDLEPGKLVSFEVPTGPDVSKLENFLPRIKDVKFYEAPPAPERSDWYGGRWNHDGHTSTRPYGYRGDACHAALQHRNDLSEDHRSEQDVIPFVRQAVGRDELKKYLYKTVTFSVIGERRVANQDFILCEVEDNTSPDIRVFSAPKTKLGKLLLNSEKLFTGKVKGMTTKQQFGNYLTLDHRTIHEVDNTAEIIQQRDDDSHIIEVEDCRTRFPVFGGRLVSIEDWYKATERGCNWCSDYSTPAQAEDLEWLNVHEYICPECMKSPEVRQYFD